tara:strand:- start:98 stop:604 length:507 start_codon:yes stop_codon:yes gene_type:complete
MSHLLSLIVAFDQNRVIGKDGTLPWSLPRDLRRFKEISLGKTVVMGRKTHQSIGRILPDRKNVVISSNASLVDANCLCFTSLRKALKALEGDKEVFIIGGESIYRESIPLADKIYLTEIDCSVEGGDVYFPKLDLHEWEIEIKEKYLPDLKNKFGMTFKVLHKKKITC